LLCEKWQEKQFTSCVNHTLNSLKWGNGLKFDSLPGMYTQLMRLGFRLYHESKHYYNNNGTTLPTEVWVKDM